MKAAMQPSRRILRLQLHASPGQSLGEYVVIGVLVAIVAIAGFMLVGKNMSKQMVYLERDVRKTVNATALMASLRPKSSYTVTLKIPQGNGKYIEKTFQVSTNPMSSSPAATSGANGSTLGLSANAQTVQSLMEMGMTKEQANTLMQLSNQGHKMAAILQIVESAVVESGGSTETFMKTSIAFNGKTYNDAWELSQLLSEGGAEWTAAEDLVEKLEASGAMSDPVLAAFVDAQVQSIRGTIQQQRELLYNTTFQGPSGSTNLAGILALDSSSRTHDDAKDICNASGSNDSGTYCSNPG